MKSKSNLEYLSHYSVIVIAISALIVSVWQVSISHKHNMLTVRPLLDFHIALNDTTIEVTFSNEGFGPAIINEMSYKYEGKFYETIDEVLIASDKMKGRMSSSNYESKAVISSGSENLILVLRNPKLQGIEVKIDYESIYKEKSELVFEF